MVAESPVHFECRYLSTHRFTGNSKVGTVDIVFAQVERIHIDENFLTPGGKLDIPRIRPLARLGYYDYTSVTDIFEMRIPNASAAEADGLGGHQSDFATANIHNPHYALNTPTNVHRQRRPTCP